MKKVIITLSILTTCSLYAVHIGTAKHYPDGLKILNYLTYTSADNYNNKDGNTIVNNYGLSVSQYIFRPLYYSGNFVYQMIAPFKKSNSTLLNQSDTGVGDIKLGVGYFVPNTFPKTDIGILGNIQLPTGDFDKNKKINDGNGHYALNLEFYVHKMISRVMWDGSIKYNYNFKNNDNNEKKGDELSLESSFAYMVNPKFFIGPNITYKFSRDKEINGLKQNDSGYSALNLGVEALWSFSKEANILFAVLKDYHVKNNFETTTIMSRFVYNF